MTDVNTKRFKYANQSICDLLGYSSDELCGLSVFDIHPKGALDHVIAEFQAQAARDKVLATDLPCLRKDGTIIQTDIRTTAIEIDGILHNVGFFSDITERKKAEDALRESEALYRSLVETTGTGYVVIDEHGRVLDANSEYVRLTGRSIVDEIRGRSVVEWTAEHDRERNAREVEKCFKQGFVRNLEIDYVDSMGKVIPVEINATVARTKDGLGIVTL